MDDEIFHRRLAQWQAMTGQRQESAGEVEIRCEALCTLYLDASNEQRLQLIHLFRTPPPWEERPPFAPFDQLFAYIRSVAGRIKSETDVDPVYLGLAAAAIAGHYPDYRDALLALARLHYAATQAGIDPTPYFEEIAASTVPETREFLQAFLGRDEVKRKQAVRIYGTRRHKELPDSGYPRLVFELAHQEAQGHNRNYTPTGDLLLGLLHMRAVTALLKELGVDADAVRTATEAAIETSTDLHDRGTLGGAFKQFNLTQRLSELHHLLWRDHLRIGFGSADEYVYSWAYEYLLVAIYEGKNTASQVLQSFGVGFERAKAAALKVFEEQAVVVGDYDE